MKINKFFLFALGIFLGTWFHSAWASQCTGTSWIPGGSVFGSCHGGSCSGHLQSMSISANGYCDQGVHFTASGYTLGGFVYGRCVGGSFFASAPSDSVMWNGHCSDGKQFSGSSSFFGGQVSGSCSDDGSFFGTVSSSSAPVYGACQ